MKINMARARQVLERSYAEAEKYLDSETLSEMALPSYLEGTVLSRWFAWRKLKHILHSCGHPRNAHILDYGCGSGVLFETLFPHCERLYASDMELGMARITSGLLGLNEIIFLHPEDIVETIPNKTIDIVIAANVLEHVSSLSDCLGIFADKLKTDGFLIVSGPTENRIYRLGRAYLKRMGYLKFTGGYHARNIHQIFQEIEGQRFRKTRHITFPLPAPLTLYWVGRFEKIRSVDHG
jgi:2-polyprenyl-3-methyl-5-hydroxy-6-metoxy-1,4-benzoquinol methylase